jgi:hypothetical protein
MGGTTLDARHRRNRDARQLRYGADIDSLSHDISPEDENDFISLPSDYPQETRLAWHPLPRNGILASLVQARGGESLVNVFAHGGEN